MIKETKEMDFPMLKSKSQAQTSTFFKPLLASNLDPNVHPPTEMVA